MSESTPKTRQRSEDVADLFRILRFMSSDVDVTEAHFRIAFRIAQFAHVGTSVAKVGDDTLMDHLPRTDGKKLRLFRRAMETSGWMRLVEGERGRPTRYVFLDTRVAEIEKRLNDAAAKREAEFALERSKELSAMKSAAFRARIDAETGEIQQKLREEYDPLIQPSKGGNLCRDKGAILPPLLPNRSTYKTGYRKQDETRDAHASMPAGVHVPVRADPVRCSCGQPAVVEVRLIGDGHFTPECRDCADDSLHSEEQSIRAANLVDDAHEVRPIPANDPGTDYRRVRDGG